MGLREHKGIWLHVENYDVGTGTYGAMLDCTPYLFADSLRLSRERERDRFEFVVDSLSVRLSNLDDTVRQFFQGIRQSANLHCSLYMIDEDGVLRAEFTGKIEPKDVGYDMYNEVVSFDAMSMQRRFFDKAGATPVPPKDRAALPASPAQTTTTTLGNLMRLQMRLRGFFGERIINRVDLGSFDSQIVQYNSNQTTATFMNIDDSMTWYDFCQQLSMYYNAEWYIEPKTGTLQLLSRNQPIGDAEKIAHLVKQQSPPEIRFVDQDQIDYLLTYLLADTPAPELISYELFDVSHLSITERLYAYAPPGPSSYVMVYYVEDEPRFKSKQLDVPGYADSNYQRQVNRLKIPVSKITNVTKRRLFRWSGGDANSNANWREVASSLWRNDNTNEVTYDDHYPIVAWSASDALPDVTQTGTDAYMRYDENEGKWVEPIYGVGDVYEMPEGVILDVRPKIQFRDPSQPASQANAVASRVREATSIKDIWRALQATMTPPTKMIESKEVFEFFNSELSKELFYPRFKEMFLTKRAITLTVRGVDYPIGLPVTISKWGLDQYGEWVIKRAEIDYMKQETKLTLFTLKGANE